MSNNLAINFLNHLQGVMHTVVVYIFKAVQTIYSQGSFNTDSIQFQVYSMTDHGTTHFIYTSNIETYLMARRVEMRHVEVMAMFMSHFVLTNNAH